MPLSRAYLGGNVRSKSGFLITPAALIYELFTNPATFVANGLSVSHAGQVTVGTGNMILGGSLCVAGVGFLVTPRNVVITVTHGSAVVAMSGVITGTDRVGNPITEAWSVTAGGTTKTFTGNVAFATVTAITETIAADASTNTIVAGSGVKLGLLASVSCASLVKETSAGAVVTNGTIVLASSAVNNDPRGTYVSNAAPNGATTYEVWYISNTVTQSP